MLTLLTVANSKVMCRDLIVAQRQNNLRQSTPAERDWSMGYRWVLHSEAQAAVRQLPHFFRLPIKVLHLQLQCFFANFLTVGSAQPVDE